MVPTPILAVFGGHPTPPTPYPTPFNALVYSVLQLWCRSVGKNQKLFFLSVAYPASSVVVKPFYLTRQDAIFTAYTKVSKTLNLLISNIVFFSDKNRKKLSVFHIFILS